MLIGYARVSSKDQSLERQIKALTDAGVSKENIYTDKASGKDFARPQYQAMLKALRTGDTLIVKELDRFGRSYEEIRKEFAKITNKGIYINVLDMPMLNTDQTIDAGLTGKFISDLILTVLGYVAEQERLKTKQRQAEGIKVAKANKVKFGRPALNPSKFNDAKALVDAGHTVLDACKMIGISRKSYYNYNKNIA